MLELTVEQQEFFRKHNIYYVTTEEYRYVFCRLPNGRVIDAYNLESVELLIRELTEFSELQKSNDSFLYSQVKDELYILDHSASIGHYSPEKIDAFNPIKSYCETKNRRNLVTETDDYCDFVSRNSGEFRSGNQFTSRGWKKKESVMKIAITNLQKEKLEYQEKINLIDKFIANNIN